MSYLNNRVEFAILISIVITLNRLVTNQYLNNPLIHEPIYAYRTRKHAKNLATSVSSALERYVNKSASACDKNRTIDLFCNSRTLIGMSVSSSVYPSVSLHSILHSVRLLEPIRTIFIQHRPVFCRRHHIVVVANILYLFIQTP